MSVFGDYSNYYDLLYKDKNYELETNFIDKLVKKYNLKAKTLLDLGCGTGKHDFLLSKKGYKVTGVDISKDMLAKANSELKNLSSKNRPKFCCGDIRKIEINENFDVITSLFHVVSYLTSNQDLNHFFETTKAHINPNGLLIFDFWYGPAVLTLKPEVKIKRLENKLIQVTRIAEPKLFDNQNLVEVNYDVFIKNKKSENINELKETHRMRYFFLPEIEYYAQRFGFKIIEQKEWLSLNNPTCSSWGVYCIMSR